MSERIITVSESLWLTIDEAAFGPEGDDLFSIRDDTGGDTLIAKDEIPALIEALNSVEPPKTTEERTETGQVE